ncbi:aminotransferase class I/II-fold pyridoxal phosphate-dependent enzyme [Pseudoroseomonas wenyumeiae]
MSGDLLLPEQILLTFGANHAFDIVIRHLTELGDTVLVDDPGYYPLFGKLRLARVRAVGVRRLPDGPDPDDLEAKLAEFRPKAFFTQSLAHNPTGGTLTRCRASRGARRRAAWHDDRGMRPFRRYPAGRQPRLAALDGLQRVISVGTFSKTLSASLRVGYVAAAPSVVEALNDLKMLTVVSTSSFAEQFIAHLINGGHYLRHLRRLRSRIDTATATAVANMAAAGWHVRCRPEAASTSGSRFRRASTRRICATAPRHREFFWRLARSFARAGPVAGIPR